MYPECVRKLIDSLKKLPGVGEKSAERMAFSIMNFSSDSLLDFSQSLIDINDVLFVIILRIEIFVIFVLMNLETIIQSLSLKSLKILFYLKR